MVWCERFAGLVLGEQYAAGTVVVLLYMFDGCTAAVQQ